MNLEPDLVLHTKIKEEEDDTSNIINLDLNKSPEDLVYEWNSKVRLKFKNYSVDSEQSLDLLMKWYITVIKEEAVNLEDFQNLKLFTTNHMQLLKLYFIELNCCFVDNYLDNMEEILLFYVNLELKSLPSKKKDGNKRAYKKFTSSVCQKIISLLNLYLLNRGDRMCHVVMKIKSNLQLDESKDLLNLLYGNFLTKRPKEKSDLEFCRAYILYQKWKTIRKSEDWEKMDEVMYNLHERTPDSIKTNPILKQILLPKNNSILDTLAHISEKHLIIAEEYFKYIKSNKGQEDNIMVSGLGDIEIQDDDIVPDLAGDSEDQEFEKAYKNFVKSMSTVCLENDKTSDECVNIKVESVSEDEDCQIVSVTTLGNEPEAADVIHEILDDDEDDIEIIYLKKNSDKQNAPREDKRKGATLSFLESIEVVEARDVSTERVSSSTNNGCAPLPTAINLVDTSNNTKVVIADSPTSSSSTQNPSTEVPNSNVVTSITQTEPLQEVTSLESELNKLLSKTEEDSNHTSYKEKTTANVVAIDVVSESNPSPVKTKNVVSIETQTDDWLADDGQDKLPPIGKHAQQRSYYYYGLDTPPSDQPPDEHIPPTTESASYPKVYANIVRTPSPNEAESLAKATETDSLSSADDNDIENNKSSLRTDDLTPMPVAQKEPCSSQNVNECNPSLLEAEFIPNVEPNTKKKWKKSSKLPEENADLINEPYIPDAGPSIKKKHKKLKKHSKHYPNLLDETLDEPNAKKKRRKLKKPSEDYGNLLEEAFMRDVDPSTKKKHKKLNKSPERNRNLLDEAFVPDVESNRKKKHRKSSKQSDFNAVPSSQRNTTSRIRLNSEEIIHHNQVESASSEFRSNDTTRENRIVSAEEATTREHPTENVSSLGVSTSRTPADAYPRRRTNLRSPSPYKYTDNNICETLTNVPCTSLEFIVTSAESNVAFNEQSGPTDISNASPDVTSTSTDAQDFGQALCNEQVEENQVLYDDLSAGVLEIEEYAVNDESYCMEECVEYSDCEFDNVTQSNIEDVVEEGVLVEVPVLEEELPFVVDETPPVGANVNICSEETSVHSHFPTDVDNDHKNAGTRKEKEKYHDQPSCCLKELKISVEKINLSPPDSAGAGSNSRKIMFTLGEKIVKPSEDDYSNTPMRWKKLREAHDLDEAFSGPISRINETNSCVNPDTNFDLFTDCGTPQPLNNSPGTSSSELTSPAFEGIEDFKTYYEENKNNPTQSRSRIEGENIATTSAVVSERDGPRRSTDANKVRRLLPRTLESLQDTSQSSGSAEPPSASVPTYSRDTEKTRSKNVKRVHITETIMDSVNSVPRLLTPVNADSAHLRGILKKSYVECQESEKGWRNMRISPRQMNSKSLRHYKVDANDALLQSEPCVCIKPITEIEISRWLSINEISRKVRLKKQTGCASPKSIKVDYNKQITSHISTNDMVQYTIHGKSVRMSLPEEFGQWRPNSVPQTKPSRLDEGTVTTNFNDNDYTNIPQQCTNSCCCSLISELILIVCIDSDHSDSNVNYINPRCNSPKYNPFLLQTDSSERTHQEECGFATSRRPSYSDINKLINSLDNSDNIEVDVNLDTSIDKNVDCQNNVSNINLSLISSANENQQPAIVPEVAEFEKTFKLEDVKLSPIPSDLHNLNLQKFSPSPCFSPQSDSLSHIFVADAYILDKSAFVSEVETDVKIQEYDEIDSFIKQKDSDSDAYSTFNPSDQNLSLSGVVNEENIPDAKFETKETAPVSAEAGKPDVSNLIETEAETRLPLKKRKLSVANAKEESMEDDDYLGPDLVEEIIKRARAEQTDKEDISYPAKPMISIAEIQEKLVEPHPRIFKTPAERKEMPPPPQAFTSPIESPRIVTEQYNNHTYNNPTINYHMNNVPYPFFPCASLPYFPPILLPLNSTTTFDVNLMNAQQQPAPQPPPTVSQPPICHPKRERRRGRKKNT